MEMDINMENRDKIVVLLAGGRIVQRQDGAELTDEELYALLPDDLRTHVVFQKWSFQPVSNYTLRMCGELIGMVTSYVHDEGARGVVVTCGISLLAELSYFADLVWNLNPPLIFTGSIFNAGTSGSETGTRLRQSVKAALSGSCTGKGALICIQDAIYAPS